MQLNNCFLLLVSSSLEIAPILAPLVGLNVAAPWCVQIVVEVLLLDPVYHAEILYFHHHHWQSTEVVCYLVHPVLYLWLAMLLHLFVFLLPALLVVLPSNQTWAYNIWVETNFWWHMLLLKIRKQSWWNQLLLEWVQEILVVWICCLNGCKQ